MIIYTNETKNFRMVVFDTSWVVMPQIIRKEYCYERGYDETYCRIELKNPRDDNEFCNRVRQCYTFSKALLCELTSIQMLDLSVSDSKYKGLYISAIQDTYKVSSEVMRCLEIPKPDELSTQEKLIKTQKTLELVIKEVVKMTNDLNINIETLTNS